MSKYTVIFKNNSDHTGNVSVYQKDPDIGIPNVMSLAWFSKKANPATRIEFDWSINYNFVWSETGKLLPGVEFIASQTVDADLNSTNKITLSHDDGAYEFKNQQKEGEGNLYIEEDGTIPTSKVSVGIGMSGFGTFVVQGEPNTNLIFTPHPKYWITFGSYKQGEVLDITSITNEAEISFPPNIYSMTATLNANNTWSIEAT